MLLIFDALKSIPTVLLALALVTLLGPSEYAVVLVVIITSTPSYARIARTQTLAIRQAEFILAERALGAGGGRIMLAHILPNIIGPILIVAAMGIPVVVAIEAGMSFLGLGVRPPTPSWGSILNDGFSYILDSPWLVVAGALPIVITTLGFTFFGEALRDAFDPKRSVVPYERAGASGRQTRPHLPYRERAAASAAGRIAGGGSVARSSASSVKAAVANRA